MPTDKSKSVKMPTHLMHEAQEEYNDLDLMYTSLQSQFCQEATHPAKNNW
jgi:hypothetical protein